MELLEALNACNDVKIYSVEDAEFSSFGRIIKGYDFEELETYMNLTSQIPEDGNVYVASVEEMESEPVAEQIAASFYGGMPIGASTIICPPAYSLPSKMLTQPSLGR